MLTVCKLLCPEIGADSKPWICERLRFPRGISFGLFDDGFDDSSSTLWRFGFGISEKEENPIIAAILSSSDTSILMNIYGFKHVT
jgi:hypothetical protein